MAEETTLAGLEQKEKDLRRLEEDDARARETVITTSGPGQGECRPDAGTRGIEQARARAGRSGDHPDNDSEHVERSTIAWINEQNRTP